MKTRQFLKSDLPTGKNYNGCNIAVLYNDEKRFVVDKHFGDDELCFLKGAMGIPTPISSLQLIVDKREEVDLENKIKNIEKMIEHHQTQIQYFKNILNEMES